MTTPSSYPGDITQILQADGGNSEQLLPLVYQELRRLAAARMAQEVAGHTLQATALVHEAWLRLVDSGARTWENRGHFFAAAAEAMRRILIERARRKMRLKRGSGSVHLSLDDLEIPEVAPDERVLLIDEALERFKAVDPERAQVVLLKFFGGLTNEDVAATMKLSERTVRYHWTYAKAWLFRSISEQKP